MVEVEKTWGDRITLSEANRKKVDQWLARLNEKLHGMVKVSRTDLVNCLLDLHSDELTTNEIRAVAKATFDEVRWLSSAMERIKVAKKKGEALSMDRLLEERNTLLGESNNAPRGRAKAQKKDALKSPEIQSGKGEERL